MAVPLVNGETTLGVLQVLDRARTGASSLGEIDLLILFANQAAIGLDLLQTARRARAVAEGRGRRGRRRPDRGAARADRGRRERRSASSRRSKQCSRRLAR